MSKSPSTAVATWLPVDPTSFSHVSIRASAGSGKTYQLTNRFLQLLAAGAEPSTILASTFTRLAAGQIRNKMLFDLAQAVNDETKRQELGKRLGVPVMPRETAKGLLQYLTLHLHVLQVRTLDSFFASVVHAFAIELGIPAGSNVVDEHHERQMRAEAIRLMLNEHAPQDLVELLRLLTQGSSERAVSETIDRAVRDLHALYREAPEESVWNVPEEPAGKLSERDVVDVIQRLEVAAPSSGSDRRQQTAHNDDCRRARQRLWTEFISKGLAAAILHKDSRYFNKPIEPGVVAAYRPVIDHACATLVGRVRDQTLATHRLLALYHAQYQVVKQRRRAVAFADLTDAMSEAIRLDMMEEIGFRLDAKLHHLLLDEFQDTSVPQWRALHPIALELVSQGPPERTFFCVGDVKQSIYDWRNAAPEVLDGLPKLLAAPDGTRAIEERNLAKSYRSSQVVIDVVNRVFESLPNNNAVSDYPDAVDAWLRGFEHHETERTKYPGYAEFRAAPRADDGEDKTHVRLNDAADLAEQLHHDYPHLRIAILTRTNKAVARLLYELGPGRRNIPGRVSGRGGGPLTDAPAVNAILDLLQLADHPDDTVAAFHIAATPLGTALKFTQHDDQVRRHQLSRQVRRQLIDEGYAAAIAGWAREIEDSCGPREFRRVIQLADLGAAHDPDRTLRTRDFIDRVEVANVADLQPAAVQVMTIHQSKGLEFDIVILPELQWMLAGVKTPPVVFEREEESGPIARICRYMNDDVRGLVPELNSLFDRHRRRTVRESLCLLYVAMTRAIHGLYMIIDAPEVKKDGTPSDRGLKSPAGILRCALTDDDVQPGAVIYSHGEPPVNWRMNLDRPQVSPLRPVVYPPQQIALAESTDDGQLRGVATAPASAQANPYAAGTSTSWLALPDDAARDRGTALHALFEQIEWLGDFQPDPDKLHRLVRFRMPRRDEHWSLARVQEFLTWLTQPAVKDLLSREGRSDIDTSRVCVHRELPFARIADGGLQSGYIDRVVVHYDSRGVPESAEIIDFKTASETSDDAEHYRPQLHAYQAAAAELFNIKPERISLTVLLIRPSDALAIRL